MSWKTQARDSKGRFLPKVQEPVKTTRKTRSKKPSDITQFNVIVLDQSSSMRSVKNETILGFNEVLTSALDEASKNKIKTYYGYTLFSSFVTDRVISPNSPKLLSSDTYNPEGCTALNDAIGSTLKGILQFINYNGITNPKVVVTILTDGEENNSRVYSSSDIKIMIEEFKNLGWVINYIGAGKEEDVKNYSKSIGIYESNTMAYTANNAESTKKTFNKLSEKTRGYTLSVAYGSDSNQGFFAD